MTGVFLALSIILVIAALIIRDQTKFKLSRMRAELFALRAEERRLEKNRMDLEKMVAQVGEALMRADERRKAMKQSWQELTALLEEVGVSEEEKLASEVDILPPTE